MVPRHVQVRGVASSYLRGRTRPAWVGPDRILYATMGLCLRSKEGYSALARIGRQRGLKLYRMKPKLHQHDHVV